MSGNNDFFSRLVNWFTMSGQDKQPISRSTDQQDFFSKLMNKISG
jgi:hypothetical protein